MHRPNGVWSILSLLDKTTYQLLQSLQSNLRQCEMTTALYKITQQKTALWFQHQFYPREKSPYATSAHSANAMSIAQHNSSCKFLPVGKISSDVRVRGHLGSRQPVDGSAPDLLAHPESLILIQRPRKADETMRTDGAGNPSALYSRARGPASGLLSMTRGSSVTCPARWPGL